MRSTSASISSARAGPASATIRAPSGRAPQAGPRVPPHVVHLARAPGPLLGRGEPHSFLSGSDKAIGLLFDLVVDAASDLHRDAGGCREDRHRADVEEAHA